MEELEFTQIAIFSGSWVELSVIDFSCLNLRFLNAKSEEFQKIIADKEIKKDRTQNVIKTIIKTNGDSDKMQALIPIDFTKVVAEENYWFVRNILLLIFPSDITLHYLLHFQICDNKINFKRYSSYSFSTTGYEIYDNYLTYYENELDSINKFIPVFNDRLPNIPYAQSAFNAYLSSFFQNFKSMEFINLCIGLESIVDAHTELNYRIRRNTAIMLTSEVDFSKLIFLNVGKIYTLRSKIVHSGKYKPEKIIEYLPYLRNVVSRLIIEVISHDIKSVKELNDILTTKGYGDNKSISESYTEYSMNSSVRSNAMTHELKKL